MTDWTDPYHCPVSTRGILCTEAKDGALVLKAAVRQAREDALEEAAKVVDRSYVDVFGQPSVQLSPQDIAAAIRRLKDKS